jgi:hypothetical protein
MISITLRMPEDVVDSLKNLAPRMGHAGYQSLIKAYVGEGLRRDEAEYLFSPEQRLAEALKARGVDAKLVEEAVREITR